MTRHTILFLAANPQGSNPLALDREVRAIQAELERAASRAQFEFVTRWAVEPMDLLCELRKLRPTVVHFSGHGQKTSSAAGANGPAQRDIGHPDQSSAGGLHFQAADGGARLVSAAAIKQTFGAAGSSVRLVVLSACYSVAQAEALLEHVDCVVGMGGAIRDDAARHFAVGFYGGLGERESVAAAYRQGKAAISLEGLRESDLPQLQVRAGMDAERLVLGATPFKNWIRAGGAIAVFMVGWSWNHLAALPPSDGTPPFAILVPDQEAAAMLSPAQEDPFTYVVAGAEAPLPRSGIIFGTAGLPVTVADEYRQLVHEGFPLNVPRSGSTVHVLVKYEGAKHCEININLVEKRIWRVRLAPHCD